MEHNDMISHTIQIAGEKYPVRLTQKEKSIASEIEKEINGKISEFKSKYLVKSTKDLLAMVLLTYAFDAKMNPQQTGALHDANHKIERILKLIVSQEEE